MGQSVTLTATVSSATATGPVTFLDGTTSLGTAPLSGGTASLSTSALAAGSHPLAARYEGSPAFGASTSASLTQVVNVPAPTIATITPDNGAAGTSVTITGTNLTDATAVTFNGTTAPGFVVNSDGTSITVSVPTGATSGTIAVTTPGGTATSATAFTVLSCQAPTNVAVSSLTPTSASVSFDASDTASGGYTVSYTPSGGTTQTAQSSTSPVALTGLTPNTSYTVTVTSNCAGALTATATPAVAFATLCEKPVLTVPVVAAVPAETGQCSASVAFAATATGAPTPTITYAIGSQAITSPYRFPLGTTTVTATATSSCNSDVQTFTVQVTDTQVPVITADGNKKVASDAGKCGATVVLLASATDNCTVGTPAGTRSDNQPLTADYPVGTTTITWNVADASGNAALAVTQTVTVTDTQKPTITAPAALTASADAGQCTASKVALGTPVTADNCTVASVTNDAPTTFAQGPTTVTWTVTDASGNTATATQTIMVVDKQQPVLTVPAALTRSTDATSCEAATGAWLGSATASDNCSGVVNLTNDAPASFPLGTTTVTYQAVDAAGNIATATQLVTVTNATPVINVVSGPVGPLPLSTTVTMTASFTDNNLKAATWTWDDGTSSPGVISGTTVSGSHLYASPSVNHVLLTITDACGLTATKTFEYVVVYDPNGGFVTGGGWILSPVNTTLPYMQVGGKATFGFVAKYAKGSQVAGNTDFQFQAGNLTFKSSSLTDARLVIAGSLANYKGVGTINGAGNYGFMVAAVDGDYNKGTGPDKFRMKIWDVASGKIVYDNQAGDGEDAAASTAISSGSIVIHNANDKASAATASVRLLPDGSLNSSLEALALTSYPNPFSTQTTLAFSFAQAQDYTLAIYDLKGSLVQRVQASRAQAGQRYEVSLDAQALSSGLYMARLTTGSGVQTLKLVVQK